MEKKVFINIEDSHSGHDDSYSSQTSTQGVLRLLENGYGCPGGQWPSRKERT